MKAKDSWAFSAPLANVDVARIIREARVGGSRVVRFTIDGKVYTAWDERYFKRIPASLCEPLYVEPGGNPVVRVGEVFIEGTWGVVGTIRIEAGDHIKALFDRVEVQVEVF